MRYRVAESLGRIGSGAVAAVPALTKLSIDDQESYVREEAAKALIAIAPDDPGVMLGFIATMKNDESRDEMTETLRQLRDGAILVVIAALRDENARTRSYSISLVEEFGVIDCVRHHGVLQVARTVQVLNIGTVVRNSKSTGVR